MQGICPYGADAAFQMYRRHQRTTAPALQTPPRCTKTRIDRSIFILCVCVCVWRLLLLPPKGAFVVLWGRLSPEDESLLWTLMSLKALVAIEQTGKIVKIGHPMCG